MKQQPQKAAPTAAQSAILHVAQSAGLSALVSLLIGTAQYLSTGNIDVHTLLATLGGGFLTACTMVYKSVSNNPQLAQAALDTANEAIQRIEQMTPGWLNQDIQKAAKPAPKPISFPPQGGVASIPVPPPAQSMNSGGGGMPPDYYSRYQRPSLPDMATQGYVPAINLAQQPFTNQNQVPPAQQQSALYNLANQTQQGG